MTVEIRCVAVFKMTDNKSGVAHDGAIIVEVGQLFLGRLKYVINVTIVTVVNVCQA